VKTEGCGGARTAHRVVDDGRDMGCRATFSNLRGTLMARDAVREDLDTAPYSRESGEGCNRLHNDAIASRLVKLPVRNTWEM